MWEPDSITRCGDCGGRGSDWLWVQTNKDFIKLMLDAEAAGDPCTECSLDHDLGEQPGNIRHAGMSPDGDGTSLAMALYHLRMAPPTITIHSWNQAGAESMAGILRAAGSDVTVRPYVVPENHCLLCGRNKEVCGDCLKRDA